MMTIHFNKRGKIIAAIDFFPLSPSLFFLQFWFNYNDLLSSYSHPQLLPIKLLFFSSCSYLQFDADMLFYG